jgi:transcriptional regulator with XRE-family HTH domain
MWATVGVEAPTRVSSSGTVAADADVTPSRVTRAAAMAARRSRHHPRRVVGCRLVTGSVSRLYAVPGRLDTGLRRSDRWAAFSRRANASTRSRTVGVLTQQALADRAGVHVTQLRRYEAGTNQPTLNVLRALALALCVSTNSLVFTDDERGPTDPGLRLHLEAINHLDPDEQATVRTLIEGTLLRHQARKLNAS